MEKETEYKIIETIIIPGDLAFIKSIFDANNIRYLVEGENLLYMRALPARIRVDVTQFEAAEELLKEFRKGNKKTPPTI